MAILLLKLWIISLAFWYTDAAAIKGPAKNDSSQLIEQNAAHCTLKCAQQLVKDMKLMMKEMNVTFSTNINDLLNSANPARNKPEILRRMCTNSYPHLKTCINSCQTSDVVTLMNMGISTLDYVCRDHLQEFLDSLPCRENVTLDAMANECKTVYLNIVDTVNSSIALMVHNPNVTLNDTVVFMDITCWMSFDMIKCLDPLMTKTCGLNVSRLDTGLFDVVADSIIHVIDYMKSVAKKTNSTISSPTKCAKAKVDNKLLAMTHQKEKDGSRKVVG